MLDITFILILLGCIGVTFLLTHFFHRSRFGSLEAKGKRAQELEDSLVLLQQKYMEAQTTKASLETALIKKEESFQEKIKILEEAKKHLSDAFTALSSKALEQNNKSFLELAQQTLMKFQETAKGDLALKEKAISELVSPLKESLKGVDQKLAELEKERSTAYQVLRHQVTEMISSQKELRQETANLVKALRTPHVRGRWGEMQLKRVVEMSGMTAHCDFIEQQSIDGDEGRLRPDMIVKLPGGKKIIIDAKAPLSAYLEALESVDDEARIENLRAHARQVKTHIIALSSRSYWDQFKEGETPEFVVLFLPGETFFSAALEQDPTLMELGAEKRVILATPTTLMALLHAVAYGWKQEKIAENAREISDLGRELYKRLSDMGGHVAKLGQDLGVAVKSYNKAIGTLESRVMPQARRFRELGSAPDKENIDILESLDPQIRELQAPEFQSDVISHETKQPLSFIKRSHTEHP
ncbi:DNA recombination protein RmuC [Candidatus Nucleicultrix amoebiphila]|jgi:DNA recombination protein RmuC|uniref:DNA recombination protein RmuC n=1 Tax=Candidatus Nucleicultrix amoebiphila TaxID=1509244 RepID=UPI000A26B0C6|nr:DNA recombination protein RmuC [Candidatus Nucleicultrix amoebiphila]